MKKINILIILVIISTFGTFSIASIDTVSAISIKGHYIYAHCEFNISYIKDNICKNCTPSVTASPLNKWYYINNEIGINGEGNLVEFFPINLNYSTPYKFNFSNDTIDFLKKACYINITPVLNYLYGINITEKYNDFYSYPPKDSNGTIIKIHDIWYLISNSPDGASSVSSDSILAAIIILFSLIGVIIIIICIIIIYKKMYKR